MQKNKENLMPKLIFLIIISTIIVSSISLSKFQSITDGSSSTKVAIYAMNAYSNDSIKNLQLDSTGDIGKIMGSRTYVVTNKVNDKITEVAVTYKIKVNFEEKLPVGITIDVKDEKERKGNLTITENSYIFENAEWKFTPGTAQANTITITFTGENIENATSSTISNVQVSVMVEQID